MSINDIPLGRLKEILASDVPLTIVTTEALIARLEQAEAAVERVRESLSNHPRACEEHPENDAIKCGWKNAVIDVQNALDGEQS